MALSVRSSFSWGLLGNIVYATAQWAVVMVLARMGSAEAIGQFTYALAVASPIVLLIGGRNVQVTDVSGRYSTGDYLTQRIAGVLCSTAVVATLSLALPVDATATWVIVWVGVAKGVEAVADVLHGLFHQRQRLDLAAKSLAMRGMATIVVFTAVFSSTRDLVLSVAAMTLAWIGVVLGFDLIVSLGFPGATLRPRVQGLHLFPVMVPLGVATALGSLTLNVPRYLIEAELGAAALGIFSALAYVLVVGRLVASAIHHAILPRLAVAFATGDLSGYLRLFWCSMGSCLGLGIATVALSTMVGEPALRLAYGDVYAVHHRLFIAVAAAGALSYPGWIVFAALSAAKSYRSEALAQVMSLVLVMLSGPWLVSRHGLHGAVSVLALAYVSQLLVRAFVLVRVVTRRTSDA